LSPKKLTDKEKKEHRSTNSKRNSKQRADEKITVESEALEKRSEETLDYELFDERRSEDVVYAPRSESYWKRLAQGLQTRVASGDVGSFWRLARLYEDGRGVKRDWKRMRELLEQGAAKNEPNATARLGLCYEYAIGVKYDPERSSAYYKKASTLADDFELVGLVQGKTLEHDAEEKARSVFLIPNRGKKAKRRVETVFITDKLQDGAPLLEMTKRVQRSCSAYSFKRLAFLVSKLGRPEEFAQKVAAEFLGRAVNIWRAEAALGNLAAGFAIGELVDSGIVAEEAEELDKFLLESLDCEYAPGMSRFALKLEEQGMGEAALDVYRRACEKDWPDALCKTALIELNALDDAESSFQRLRRGVELKHAPSIYFLGDYYWNVEKRQDRRRAVDLFRRAAEMGLGVAQERYADYLNSDMRTLVDGLPPNPEEAFLMYKRACDGGRELAQVACACMLYEGEGVEQDVEQADKIFRQILEYGAPKAKEALALRFLDVECYEDRIELAIRTLKEIAQDLPSSYVVLGFCYYIGKSVRRDLRRAAEYFGLAAAGGEPIGAINFARCCLDGSGVSRNPLIAEFFLRLAASQDDPIAAFQLGELYAKGEEIPQNWRYAFEWYNLAFLRENKDAIAKLAECYWNGLGVARDYDKAIRLWTSAVSLDESGTSDAAEDLERAILARMVQNVFEQKKVKRTVASKRKVRTSAALDETRK